MLISSQDLAINEKSVNNTTDCAISTNSEINDL